LNLVGELNKPDKNKPLLGTPVKRSSFVLVPPRRPEQTKTVMVLGVERGGTSMVAGVLRALGVNMGDRVGYNHEDARFLVDDTEVLQRRIRARNKQEDVWGFKIPKAVQFLGFFEQNLRNPYYVIVMRNLLAIADSWQQRGSGNIVDTLDRTFDYYQRIIEHCKNTSRPVVMVNYERAVGSEAGKQETVREIAEFLGIPLDADLLDRALGMVTGDGAGYLNLPEHFLAVAATREMPQREALALQLTTPELFGGDDWIDFQEMKQKLTFVRPDNSPLPSRFWLQVELDADPRLDLTVCPLRVYVDYVGAFFPAHCARPPVQRGINHFLVETSGLAKGLALGPLEVPARFRLKAEVFHAGDEDQPQRYGVIADNLARPDAARRA
jgi:hypothetical protein